MIAISCERTPKNRAVSGVSGYNGPTDKSAPALLQTARSVTRKELATVPEHRTADAVSPNTPKRYNPQRVNLRCEVCDAPFTLLKCQMTRGRGRFCSRHCANIGHRRGSTLTCAQCGKAFYRHLAEQDRGVKVNQFCSRECYMVWRDENRSPDTYPKQGAVHKHRIVAEQILGRPLLPEEVVHHIDLNKANYEPSNLAVFPDQSTHARCHFGEMSDEELRRFSLG